MLRFWPEARRRRTNWGRYVPLWAGAALIGTAYGGGWLEPGTPAQSPTTQSPAPAIGAESQPVVGNAAGPLHPVNRETAAFSPNAGADADADRFAPSAPDYGGEAVRADFAVCHTGGGTNCVVDGDTLWLGGEKIRVADIDAPETHPPNCAEEARLGDAATRRLRELLNNGAVSLQAIDRDSDRYGRKLRVVLVDGRSVGETLVAEGLARPYGGGRRPWC